MAQPALFDIALAAVGIDDVAVIVLRHGVDGEVAAREVLLQRHRWIGIDHETAISTAGLAFGSRQRVFLTAVGMQEHREVLANRLEPERLHLVLCGANDNVVDVTGLQFSVIPAEQAVAHAAADPIRLHRGRRS